MSSASPKTIVTSITVAQANAGVAILAAPDGSGHAFKAIGAGNPALIECDMNVPNGATVVIAGSNTAPTVDGVRVATNVNGHSFTVPIAVGTFNISAVSTADPTHLTVDEDIPSGSIVTIVATATTPATVGAFVATRIDSTHISIPVHVTSVATGTGSGTILAASGGSLYIPDRVPTSYAITGISKANPTVITCADPVLDGSVVVLSGTDSVPCVDGTWTAHFIDSTHFSINAQVLTAGTTGSALILDAPTALRSLRVLSATVVAHGTGSGAGSVLSIKDTSDVVVMSVPLANLVDNVPSHCFSSGNTITALRKLLTAGAGLKAIVTGGTLATTTAIDIILEYVAI